MATKLSPSDFKFLWKDCKHCYYRKIKDGITPPAGAFPSVFTYMNNLLQNNIKGKNLQEIHPDLPNAIVENIEGYLKSMPIPGAENYYISGRYDIVCRLDDGTYMIVDFKIMNPSEESLLGYATQLHAYKFALENPTDPNKDPKLISQMGLISIKPEDIRLDKGNIFFIASPKFHKIEINMDDFFKTMNNIATILDGPLPLPSESCKYCRYRQATAQIEGFLPVVYTNAQEATSA